MRNAWIRSCLSGLLVASIPTLTLAAIGYGVKSDGAALFRAQTLEPPPLAVLAKGKGVKLVFRGAAQSLVETEEGLKGWIRNEDFEAIPQVPGKKVRLTEQVVRGGWDYAHSEIFLQPEMARIALLSLHRSFSGDIAGNVNKEQLEMHNQEN